MGFVLLGIATLTATGIQAALIGNIAHGVHHRPAVLPGRGDQGPRAHRRRWPSSAGCARRAPRLAGLLGFAAIASLGLPGLAGFWGEAFAVVAAVERGGPLWIDAGRARRGRRRADRGVLPAPAAPGHPRPGRAGGRWPAAAGARRRRAGSPGRRWSLLALVLGLVPALVLGLSADPVAALIDGGGDAGDADRRPRRAAAGVRWRPAPPCSCCSSTCCVGRRGGWPLGGRPVARRAAATAASAASALRAGLGDRGATFCVAGRLLVRLSTTAAAPGRGARSRLLTARRARALGAGAARRRRAGRASTASCSPAR